MFERHKLYPESGEKTYAAELGAVLDLIKANADHFLKSPASFLIRKSITPKELKKLDDLPLEVELIYDRESNSLILNIGRKNTPVPKYHPFSSLKPRSIIKKIQAYHHTIQQAGRATVHAHNHPPMKGDPKHRLSQGDRNFSSGATNADVFFVATSIGIIFYWGPFTAGDITWAEEDKVQLACDMLNGQKTWSDVCKELNWRNPWEKWRPVSSNPQL